VESTLRYNTPIRHARCVRMEGTGHLGLVLRPGEFSARIAAFVDDIAEARERRCRAV
jgi:hypothetical protein